jgi:hypothetical protein
MDLFLLSLWTKFNVSWIKFIPTKETQPISSSVIPELPFSPEVRA